MKNDFLIHVRVPKDVKAELEAAATKAGSTVSDMLRSYISLLTEVPQKTIRSLNASYADYLALIQEATDRNLKALALLEGANEQFSDIRSGFNATQANTIAALAIKTAHHVKRTKAVARN